MCGRRVRWKESLPVGCLRLVAPKGTREFGPGPRTAVLVKLPCLRLIVGFRHHKKSKQDASDFLEPGFQFKHPNFLLADL